MFIHRNKNKRHINIKYNKKFKCKNDKSIDYNYKIIDSII